MRRGPKPAKSKEAKPSVARKSPKDDGARARDLEKRLAEAVRREKEGQEQQAATAEILRIISRSPANVQPVFDAIVANAARLCGADFSAVTRFDGGLLHLVAVNNMSAAEAAPYHTVFPRAPGRHFVVGRAFVDGRPVHVEDIETDPDYDPRTREILGRAARYRTFLGVPILRDGVSIGAIGCGRHEMKPFTATQIELVKTFADQAVIAIENVRLFKELEEKNRALTEAHATVTESLERQTATSEILGVISQSPTDVEPVFETITRNAVRLCDGINGHLYRFDGELVHLAAHANVSGQAWVEWQQTFPRPLSEAGGVRHVMETGQVLNVDDFEDFEGFTPAARALWAATGIHSTLLVPMMLQGQAI